MPLVNESHDSLPYIEPAPSEEARRAAAALVAAELPPLPPAHPLLPRLRAPRFSALVESELTRVEAGGSPLSAIDTARYELAAAAPSSSSSSSSDPTEAWRRACAASSHLSARAANLALLERFGRNAWLVGNARLEGELRGLEAELAAVEEATEALNRGRRAAQERVRGELEALEAAWRAGVAGLVHVLVAGEAMREAVLEERRRLAV